MERYRLYGIRLDSEHCFQVPLWPGSGPAELTLGYARRGMPEPRHRQAVYRSPLRTPAGERVSVLYRLDRGELLCFPPEEAFLLSEDRILCSPPRDSDAALLEIRFLGAVMAYWLELRGIAALHASAVEIGGRAVAFAAGHAGGKTSLAATFIAAGHRLLADDLLAVKAGSEDAIACAGYPAMRFWPDQVQRFLAGRRPLRRVHPDVDKRLVEVGHDFGAFVADDLPLAAVYLPRPRDDVAEPAVYPVRGTAVLRELLGCSFTPYIVEAVGLQEKRLDRLARLARSVAVRRLDLPHGLSRLPSARQAVLTDLAAISAATGPARGKRLR